MPSPPQTKSAAGHFPGDAGEIRLLDADIGAVGRAHGVEESHGVAEILVLAAASARGEIEDEAHWCVTRVDVMLPQG